MKFLHVVMPDNSIWKVNAKIIAEDRACYYSEIEKEDYSEIFNETLNNNDILIDWASNEIDWNNVKDKAIKVKDGDVDYEEGWMNGEKSIKEE